MTKRFGVSIPDDLLKKLDVIAKKKGYSNRSEAIRDLVRDKFVEQELDDPGMEAVGTLTLVYDHHARLLSDRLADIQHDYHDRIVASTHIHLTKHDCAEVIILKGKSGEIKKISDRIISTKGVKHGKLVMTTTGKELS